MRHEYKELLAHVKERSLEEHRAETRYKGPYSYLLQEGKFFYRPSLSPQFNKKFTTHCFKTATKAARADSRLHYVEGIVWDGVNPKFIRHGFLLDLDGTIIDMTYRGKNKDQAFYLGISVPTYLVVELLHISKYFGLFWGKNREWFRTEAYLRASGVI